MPEQPPLRAVPIPPSTYEPEGDVVTQHELIGRLRALAFEWSKRANEVPDSLDPEVIAATNAANQIRRNCAFELDDLLDEECHARSELLGGGPNAAGGAS